MKRKLTIIFCLVMITLISLFSVSGTYAKYISSIDASDEARVAKWGMNITRDVDLFSDSYLNDDGVEVVKSKNGDNVVAPGTSGEYTFTITGVPETNYTLNLEVLEAIDTVGRITYQYDNYSATNSIQWLKYLMENSLREENVYPANKPLPERTSTHTIKWWWNFYESDDIDKIDTSIGESAIIDRNDPNYNDQPMVKLKIRVTAEQSRLEANTNLD